MDEYSNSFFKPKPSGDRRAHMDDSPCSLDAFSCTEGWWKRNIKTFCEMIEDEYDLKVDIDSDELLDGRVDVRIGGTYVMTAASKEEVSTILRTAYSMLAKFYDGNRTTDDDD